MAIAGLAWGTEELWAPEVPPFGLGTFLDELFARAFLMCGDCNLRRPPNCLINAFSLSTFRLSRGQTMTNQKI